MSLSYTHPNVICFGEVLWDVLPDKSHPGGAPMNVAYHLRKLGQKPSIISRIGTDQKGRSLVDMLGSFEIDTSYIQVDKHYATGRVNAQVTESNEMAYDIIHPVAWDFIEEDQSHENLIKESQYFVLGSLVSRTATARKTLFSLLDLPVMKVLDVNLRPPHFNRDIIEHLLGKTDLLKMNTAELELISSWFTNQKTTADKMKYLQDRFYIESVIVTMGNRGAGMIDQGTEYSHPGRRVTVADTIGSGDAFLAGFLHKKISGSAIREALAFACNLGALIATYPGACPDYDPPQN